MYLRHTTRRKDGKAHTYWRLVRSVRVGKKVVQQTVAQLGELDAQGRARARALAAAFIGGGAQADLFDAPAPVDEAVPVCLDTSRKIVGTLGSIEYYGLGLDYVDRYPALINAVTVADVQRVAQKYLDPGKYALAVVADLTKAKIAP